MSEFEATEFDYRHKAAANALANGFPIREAARSAGVSSSTVDRWKQEPAFQELIAKEKMAIFKSMDSRDREIYVASEELRVKRIRLASKLLEKIENRIEALESEDLSPRLIPAYIKALIDLQEGSEHDLSIATKIAKRYGFEIIPND